MKIYFRLRIQKDLDGTYTINQEYKIKKGIKKIETFPMAFRDLVAYLVIKI